MTGETAKLLASLDLQDNMSPKLRNAIGGVAQAETRVGSLGSRLSGLASTLRGGASTALTTFTGRIKQAGGAIANLAGIGGVAGIAGLGLVLQKSVSGAMDFSASMELLRTQTGASQAEVDSMSKAVLALGGTLPQGPEQLAAALYHVESAGYRGSQALDILKAASQGAMTGQADLEQTVNALVGAEQSGIKGAENVGEAMGTLNAIVGAGNMRMQDLIDSFGSGILASARTFGVSLKSVGAALATMTDEGIPATDASTRLRMSLSLLGAPTSKAITLLKGIGIGQYQLARDMRKPDGFVAAIGDLREHMVKAGLIGKDGNPTAQGAALISRAFGGGRSSAAIMTLLSNFDLLKRKQDAVNAGGDKFASDVAAAAAQAQNKWNTFTAALQTTAINVGNVLLPYATSAMTTLTDWFSTHQIDITNAIKGAADTAKTVFGVISGFVGTVSAGWDALPGPLRDLLVEGIAGDRVLKFAFGMSPLSGITSGIGNLVSGVFGKIFGNSPVGKLLGAAGGYGTPVQVTNWPARFGMGGGGLGGGLAGAAEAAAGGGALATIGGVFAGTLGGLLMTKGGIDALSAAQRDTTSGNLPAAVKDYGSMGTPGSLISRALFGSSDPLGDWLKSTFGIDFSGGPLGTKGIQQQIIDRTKLGADPAAHSAAMLQAIRDKTQDVDVSVRGLKRTTDSVASSSQDISASARSQRLSAIAASDQLRIIADKKSDFTTNVTVNASITANSVTRTVTAKQTTRVGGTNGVYID